MRAACHRCGGLKAGPLLPCPDCHHTPREADRSVAWLFSLAHLSEAELQEAALRIQGGETPDPPAHLLHHATERIRLGRSGGGPPLSQRHMLLLGLGAVVLTPLLGLAVWWGYRMTRPLAARQALRVTIPAAALLGCIWVGVVAHRLLA